MEVVNDEANRAAVRAAAISDSAVLRTRAEVQLRHSVTAALQAGASAAPAVELLDRLSGAVASIDKSEAGLESAMRALFGKDRVRLARIEPDTETPPWLPGTTLQRVRAIQEALASGSDISALFGQACSAAAGAVTILEVEGGVVWGAVPDPLTSMDDKVSGSGKQGASLLVVKSVVAGSDDASDKQHRLRAGAQATSTLLQVWQRDREAAAAARASAMQDQAAEHRQAVQAAAMTEARRAGSVWGRVAEVLRRLSTATDEAAITTALGDLGRSGVVG
jgi:hypothetical protein